MALTVANMITEAEKIYVRGDVSDATWQNYLDFGLENAIRDFNWHDLQAQQTYNTVANTETVTISSNIRSLFSLRLNLTSPIRRPKLVYMTPERFDEEYYQGTDHKGVPLHYTLWGSVLYLGPVPDAVYVVRSLETRWPSTFASQATSVSSPIARLEEYLIHYAVFWAFQAKSQADLSEKHLAIARQLLLHARRSETNRITDAATPGAGAYEV